MSIHSVPQDCILEAGGYEALNLGLLMAEEIDNNDEDDAELYSFQHKLIHEYVAACHIVSEIEKHPEMVSHYFPTCKALQCHI